MKSRILLFFLFILATSCISVEICDDEYESVMVAKFMTMKDGTPADSTVSSLSLFGIREGQSDTLLYTATNVFEAPLDPNHDFTHFVLLLDGQSDTLELNHHQEIYMVSYDCGFGNLFTLDSIAYHSGMIKSHEIKNELVDAQTEADDVHILLFL